MMFRWSFSKFARGAMLLFSLGAMVAETRAQNSQNGAILLPPSRATGTQAVSSSVSVTNALVTIESEVMDMARNHMVQPIYPIEAIKARISGTVVLRAIISGDGKVKDVEYIDGPKELVPAATDAVKQWTYWSGLPDSASADVQTTVAIVFALDANPPADLEAAREATGPLTFVPAVYPADFPPKFPMASRAGKSVFPDTIEGMKAQMEGALEMGRLGDDAAFAEALDSFAIEDPRAWLSKNFGSTASPALEEEYATSLFHFKEHMARMRGYWNQSATSFLQVQLSLVPKPPEGDESSKPPRPITPLPLEDFKFNIFTGKTDPGDWVFSFAYVDGAFRIVGGTFAFWDDDWSKSHASATNKINLAVFLRERQLTELNALNKGVEGIESMCPGDGLVRVFMSPKAAEERLTHRIEPAYPEEAKRKAIEGTVIFQAIIAKDGTVEELELEDGDPLLAKAAEAAVRQWRYEPMIYYQSSLGRERPAEIDTAIKIDFKLPK